MTKRLAVIIPVYGQQEMTHTLLEDIEDEGDKNTHVYIMDNKGDYEKFSDEMVARTPALRWLRGTNYGTKLAAMCDSYYAYVWLNNDTRISRGFFDGIRSALNAQGPSLGILGPSYDDVWPQQHHSTYRGPASAYVQSPQDSERLVSFVDGAGMVVTHKLWNEIGGMDERHFAEFGWGGDFDYCIRAKQAGYKVMVTERAYFNHLKGQTNNELQERYEEAAGGEMNAGMYEKWGPNWRYTLENQ
jgi:GT2 family glycosyltransferase